ARTDVVAIVIAGQYEFVLCRLIVGQHGYLVGIEHRGHFVGPFRGIVPIALVIDTGQANNRLWEVSLLPEEPVCRVTRAGSVANRRRGSRSDCSMQSKSSWTAAVSAPSTLFACSDSWR